MTALVTGGAGLIGSNICAALIKQGAGVVEPDDLSTGYGARLDDLKGLPPTEGDSREAFAFQPSAEVTQGLADDMIWAKEDVSHKG